MSNEYHLADGSPRYGRRTEACSTGQAAPPARVEEAAEAAARLGLDDLAAAIDRRLVASWADRSDPLVTRMRQDHPEELAAARDLVSLHLGSQRQWRLKAQAVRDGHLAALMARRRAAGSARETLFLRLGLMGALITPPAYIVASGQDDLVKLVLTGAACVAGAFTGSHFLTVRARVPLMPDIRSSWLAELREDVIDATLVAILANKGVDLGPGTAAAGRRGWNSIQAAARAVSALRD